MRKTGPAQHLAIIEAAPELVADFFSNIRASLVVKPDCLPYCAVLHLSGEERACQSFQGDTIAMQDEARSVLTRVAVGARSRQRLPVTVRGRTSQHYRRAEGQSPAGENLGANGRHSRLALASELANCIAPENVRRGPTREQAKQSLARPHADARRSGHGDTLAELVAIMAEPDEAAALLAIGAMQDRLERQMLGEGTGQTDAAQQALQVAERVRHAWTTLHRAPNTQTNSQEGNRFRRETVRECLMAGGFPGSRRK